MIGFVAACVGLVLLSALFYLLPRRSRSDADGDLAQSNRALFRRRQSEIEAEGNEDLIEDARLRLLEDEGLAPRQHESGDRQPMPLWWMLPFVAVFSVLVYWQLGAAPDVVINDRLQAVDEGTRPEEMQALMSAIEARASSRPQNLHYSALLGRYYMGLEDYRRAADTYAQLAAAAPEDAQALAYAAQAEYLAAGRVLSERSQMWAEQALAVDPRQRTALGLLGMASFEQGQYRAAIAYWERLYAMEAPGSESGSMISSVIAMAEQRLRDAGEPAVQPLAVAVGVNVHVPLPEDAGLSPSDTLYVIARDPAAETRMPVAVQRLTAAALPLTLRLDDSHSMAGQKLSSLQAVQVIVQVSPSGQPGAANASWLGEAEPVPPSADGAPVVVRLRPAAG